MNNIALMIYVVLAVAFMLFINTSFGAITMMAIGIIWSVNKIGIFSTNAGERIANRNVVITRR